jgi:CubicO group peptidase (beta-lactamase class C family)
MRVTGPDRLRASSLAAVDAIFERALDAAPIPGIAWGVVAGGQLVHARGIGTLRLGVDAPPDADSVYRIASMTKSFTAAAIVLLRDEGRLGLDDPVAQWVPDLASLPGSSSDSPPITIRHLLTMSAGFPTDDPWGDRQQGLDLASFAAFLRSGPGLAWAPGERFEYSNLGYAILGRVITNVAGREYRDVVAERLLRPLGMDATTYSVEAVPADRLAHGYVRRDDTWVAEPLDGYGAFASMGGVFTSVGDLARWVAGFTDAFPPRDDPESGHPLRRASRREMQEVQRPFGSRLTQASADARPMLESEGYGLGLFVVDDSVIGRTVGHGGGYPGFGSSMRWHPASGIGVVALGNARYAPMTPRVIEALRSLLAGDPAPVRRVTAWPATLEAQVVVERLLQRWDDGEAEGLFAMNVDLDEPLALRREAIERLRETHGTLRRDETEPAVSTSPADLTWWMSGERGRVRLEMLLSPERPPLVQRLAISSVPDAPAGLATIAEGLARSLGEPDPRWPGDLPLAAGADRTAIERSMRAAAARFGPVTLGRPVAGDGRTTATWPLRGARGELDLVLRLDAPDGPVAEAGFIPRPLEPAPPG